MNNPSTVLVIRAKKLGVLIRKKRMEAGKTPEECGGVIGLSGAKFEEYEYGSNSPSLPELEILASFFGVLPEHLLKGDGQENPQSAVRYKRKIDLRNRLIGAELRKARLEKGVSTEVLAEKTSIQSDIIQSYELGEVPIPAPRLELLADLVGRSLNDFKEHQSSAPKAQEISGPMQDFLALPSDLQDFITRPVNRPYLELAQKLSGMPAERLRRIAEDLLAITL